MREWAEQEFIVPDGPFEGLLFDCRTQPFSMLWFFLVDSGLWPRMFATGPSQSGKSLMCFVIPIMYHLFEMGETVVVGLPNEEMAQDKWVQDIEPAILRSRYASLLPAKGGGSRGGVVTAIHFRNGATLRFMTGGGGDKKRSAFTTRVLVMTEVDGMDEAGGKSREADKVAQLEARTEAYAGRKRVYGECTVSIEDGRTWKEYISGTRTRIVVQCRDCHAFVTPERDDLIGWMDADNIVDAQDQSRFTCPDCGVTWSDKDRETANREARVLHRGQEIDDAGQVVGDLPKTDTLGFRWNAFNNLFHETSYIGGGEWKALQSADADNAEKERLQFHWARPYVPDRFSTIPVSEQAICLRTKPFRRGLVPFGTQHLTIGCDIGERWMHWVLIAWFDGASCHVVDYGRIKVLSETLGVEKAILTALREFKVMCLAGWRHSDGSDHPPSRICVDSGHMTHVVYEFMKENPGGRFWAVKGLGSDPRNKGTYSQPKQIGGSVKYLGDRYHISQMSQGTLLVELSADYWKIYTQTRITTPLGMLGAMTLFEPGSGESHLEYAKHFTAESQEEDWVDGKGYVSKWVRKRKSNHLLDATSYACVAGHIAGVRVVAATIPKVRVETSPREPESERPFVRSPSRAIDGDEDTEWIRSRRG